MKRKIKIAVDVLLFLLFIYLLSYRPGMGLMVHALIGIAQLSLFLLHHALNLPWYKALFRGRYSFRRILLTASDFLLLLAMLTLIVSSVMISGMVFSFVSIRMRHIWRQLHVASTAWCFMLTAFHLGIHLNGFLKRIERKLTRSLAIRTYRIAQGLFVLLGAYCFTQSGLTPRLFMADEQPIILLSSELFYAVHCGIVAGMSILARWLLQGAESIKKAKEVRS